MRGSEWLSLKRCLAIVIRLQQGSVSPTDLVSFVIKTVGTGAYPSSSSAREKAFKRDRESLRKRLGVKFSYTASTKLYSLIEIGPLLRLYLPETSLRAISILSHSFNGHVGEHSEVQFFLEEVISRLSLDAQRKLDGSNSRVYIDLLKDVDPNHISKKVLRTAWKAVNGKRKFAFNYISPTYEDRQKRLQVVLPYRIQYQWGHWYLQAYRLSYRDLGNKEHADQKHLRYRLSYVQDDDGLRIYPNVMPAPPAPPKYLVHFRLLPPLSRGVISERFEDMTITLLEDGSAEVKGYCENVWEAGRTLLIYGEFCVVLGGGEVRTWIKKTVKGMAENYSDLLSE
jgi:hypothetical protein